MRMKQALTILLFIFVSGCTKLEVALSWADTFVMSEVSDYFDLSKSQKTQAKSDFNAILLEIQKNDFPRLADILEKAAQAVEKDPLTSEWVLSFYDEVEKQVKKSFQKFEPLAQKIVESQAQTNFNLFDKEFEKKFRKDSAKIENPDIQFRETIKKFNRWIDNSIGFLTDPQEEQMRAMLKSYPAPSALQLKSRRVVYESFKRSRADKKLREEIVQKLFKDWDSLQTGEYLAAKKSHQDRIKTWAVEVAKSLNEKQKKNLIKNLKARAAELRKLSKKES